MPQIQTARFKDFRGGLADNPYFVGQGQFLDGRNLEIRGKAPLVVPAVSSTAQGFTTGGSEPLCAVDNFIFCEDGKVYNTSGTLVRTLTGGPEVASAIRFNGGIYFSYGTSFHNMGYYDGSTWTDTWTTTGDTITPNNLISGIGLYPMVEFAGSIYLGSTNKVYSITAAGVKTEELTGLSSNVVGLTVAGQMLKIFLQDGDILFWDGTEGTNYNERIQLRLPIRQVYGSLTEDIIIAGNKASGADTQIYRMVGYQYEMISSYLGRYTAVDSENMGNSGQIAYSNGVIAMPGVIQPSGLSPYYGVYTYGSTTRELPPSWNFQYSTSSGGYNYSKISLIHYYQGDLYVGYTDTNATIGINKYSQDPDATTAKYSNAYLITPVFDGGARNKKKKITAMRYYGNTVNDVVIKYNTDKFYLAKADRRKLLADSVDDFTTLVTFDNTYSAEQNEKYGVNVDIEGYAFMFKIELGANSVLSELEIDFIYLD